MKFIVNTVIIIFMMIFPFTCSAEYQSFADDTIRVLYLGGEFLKDNNSYANSVTEYIKEKYASKKLESDVLTFDNSSAAADNMHQIINFDPDLVYIDFCYDDSVLDKDISGISLEKIIRTLAEKNRSVSVIILKQPNAELDAEYPETDAVIKYYNIPVIDVQKYIDKKVKGEVYTKESLFDNGRPTKDGYDAISSAITKYTDAEMRKCLVYREKAMNDDDSSVHEPLPNPVNTERNKVTPDELEIIIKNGIQLGVGSCIGIAGDKAYYVDSRNINSETKSIGGAMYIPIRFLYDALGAKIYYEPMDNTVAVSVEKTEIKLSYDGKKPVINGAESDENWRLYYENGITYVPVATAACLTNKKILSNGKNVLLYTQIEEKEIDVSEALDAVRNNLAEWR